MKLSDGVSILKIPKAISYSQSTSKVLEYLLAYYKESITSDNPTAFLLYRNPKASAWDNTANCQPPTTNDRNAN